MLLSAAKRGNEHARNILLKYGIVPIVKEENDEMHTSKKPNEGQEDCSYTPGSKLGANNPHMANNEDDIRRSNIIMQKVVDSNKPI
jgi:hypothetical protein